MKTRHTFLGAATAVLLLGCPAKVPDSSATPGDGTLRDLTASAKGGPQFGLPLDATLSPDGKLAYFTAMSLAGRPAVLTSKAPSAGAPTVLLEGDPLVSPMGIDISSDGKTLVIADRAAGLDTTDQGELFALSIEGGSPSAISGATGFEPKQVTVVKEGEHDVVYFTGRTAQREPGVFKLPLTGGMVTVLAKGEPLVDPSGIAVASTGEVYVLDVNSGNARLVKVVGGAVSEIVAGLRVGYPAGIALAQNEKVMLISALDPDKGTDVVARVDLTAPGSAPELLSAGIEKFDEPAGLKRAKNVDTYIWADSAANGRGTVFVINKQD